MTYAEFCLVADGFVKRCNREHDERMSLAWHTAAMVRIPPRGEFPPLSALMHNAPEQKEQSVDAMIAVAQMWTAALGGEVIENGN